MNSIERVEFYAKTFGWAGNRTTLTRTERQTGKAVPAGTRLTLAKDQYTLEVTFGRNGAITADTRLIMPSFRRYISAANHKGAHLLKFLAGQLAEERF